MIVEVRPKKDDPTRVEFFADGKRLENIAAGRVHRHGDVLTVQAIVTYDKAAPRKEKPRKESRGKDPAESRDEKKGEDKEKGADE